MESVYMIIILYLKFIIKKKIPKYILIFIFQDAQINIDKIMFYEWKYFNNKYLGYKKLEKTVHRHGALEDIKKYGINEYMVGKYSDENIIQKFAISTEIFEGMCVSRKNRLIAHLYIPFGCDSYKYIAKSGNMILITKYMSDFNLYEFIKEYGQYYARKWNDKEYFEFLKNKRISISKYFIEKIKKKRLFKKRPPVIIQCK